MQFGPRTPALIRAKTGDDGVCNSDLREAFPLRGESCSFGVQDFDLDGKTTRVFDRQQAEVYRYYHSEMGTCL